MFDVQSELNNATVHIANHFKNNPDQEGILYSTLFGSKQESKDFIEGIEKIYGGPVETHCYGGPSGWKITFELMKNDYDKHY